MGFATVTSLLPLKNNGYDILNKESPTDMCSLVFTNICEKNVPFQA
jgi:hypothetical protein